MVVICITANEFCNLPNDVSCIDIYCRSDVAIGDFNIHCVFIVNPREQNTECSIVGGSLHDNENDLLTRHGFRPPL